MTRLGLVLGLAIVAYAWELEETGLCIQKEGNCSSKIQRYGICCEINKNLAEFKNYCLACKAGCSVWKYKRSFTETCR